MRKTTTLLGLFFMVGFAMPIQAASATERTDLVVSLKTLQVLTNRYDEPVPMAILYDTTNLESKKDAENIDSAIKSGVGKSAGNIEITAQMIPLASGEDPAPKLAPFKVAFLARGIQMNGYATIATASAKKKILTMSTDLDCVMNDLCVLGIVSRPSVQIYYSKKASDAADISFLQAFTMLAKQL